MMLAGLGQHGELVVVEGFAVMRERAFGPRATQDRKGFVEDLRTGRAVDAERLLLVRIDNTQTERWKQPPVGEPVECGQFLGKHDRIPARKDHDAHTEFQLSSSTGRERQRCHCQTKKIKRGCGIAKALPGFLPGII